MSVSESESKRDSKRERSETLDQDITSLSAAGIARAVAERRMSAREVTEAALARVDAVNPTLNAICTLNDAALDEADAVDRRLASDGAPPPRPLEGVPVVVKDNIFTKGIRTTFGSKILEHDVPTEDSICVERLREAGAVVLGKANTPEFAHDVNTTNPVFGTTRNPWNVNHTAGGSSGGTGSAVAGRLVPAGLGTDLGGSIRIPSSFNGLAGIRPAPGRVAFYPTEYGWDTLVAHVQGPMSRTVEDVGLVLDVLAGPDDRDPMSLPEQGLDFTGAARAPADPAAALAGTRLALSIDLGGLVPVEPEVEALVRAAARDLAALGCEVTETFFDNSSLAEIIFGTRGFGMIARYTERYERHRDVMTPPLINQIEAARDVDVHAIAKAERLRTDYWHNVRALLSDHDFIITPACGAPAFRLDQPLPDTVGGRKVERYYDIFLTAYTFSVTGLPAMSIPCGFTSDGLPVGLQVVGPRLREDLVLRFAAACAAAHPEHYRSPDVDLAAARPVADDFASPGLVVR